jgi:hypothetical protein
MFLNGEALLAREPEYQVRGLEWMERAACNKFVPAFLSLARAYRDGIGTSKDLVRAYAWLTLFHEASSDNLPENSELDALRSKLSATEVVRAETLAKTLLR